MDRQSHRDFRKVQKLRNKESQKIEKNKWKFYRPKHQLNLKTITPTPLCD